MTESWDNFYTKIDEASERLLKSPIHYRRALGYHLKDIVDALHDVEWVDKGDLAIGDEEESIRRAVDPTLCLIEAQDALRAALETLQYEIDKAEELLDGFD